MALKIMFKISLLFQELSGYLRPEAQQDIHSFGHALTLNLHF